MPVSPRVAVAFPPPRAASEVVPPDSEGAVARKIIENEYCNARCLFRPPSEGGRVVVTSQKVMRGEVVGRCKPQMIIGPPNKGKPQEKKIMKQIRSVLEKHLSDYNPDDVWAALHSLIPADLPARGFPLAAISEELQKEMFVSHFPQMTAATPHVQELHKSLGLRCTALKLEQLVLVWCCNSMVHTSRTEASALCVGFALMNHSCLPSVSWIFEEDNIVLRANADLDHGAELSVSYIDDHHLHKSTHGRREYILSSGKEFTCACVRCSDPRDRSRQVSCPAAGGCAGWVPLGSAGSEPCGACGRVLTQEEFDTRVSREKQLEELLEPYLVFDSDEEEEEDDDDEEDEDEADVSNLSREQVEWIRETATSGSWLAPTGHWLAHRAQGVLKKIVISQKAGPAKVLECLDQRAAFVRQAHAPCPYPACHDFAEELLEAAKLLLTTSDGWSTGFVDSTERAKRARTRLAESVAALEPMDPHGDLMADVRKWLRAVDAGERAIQEISMIKQPAEAAGNKGVKRQRLTQ